MFTKRMISRIPSYFHIYLTLTMVLFLNSCDLYRCTTDEGCYKVASKYYHEKQYTKAAKYFSKIHSTNEMIMANTYYSLGMCYRMLGQYDKAFEYYYRVYENFPLSSLADDALAMSGGVLYYAGKYKSALDIYTKFLKEYPNSDLNFDRIWESMEKCLSNFKNSGHKYVYGDQVIPEKEFAKIAIDVTQQRSSYQLLDRFNFWDEYSKGYGTKNKFQLEYIQRLLEDGNFLEAERQKIIISKNHIQFVRFLEISKLYRLGKYKRVIGDSGLWLKDFSRTAATSLLTDCIVLRIESMIKIGYGNLELLEELNNLFYFARNTPFPYVLRINVNLSTRELELLSRNVKSPPLVDFLLAQRYFISGDFKRCQENVRQGILKIPKNNTAIWKRYDGLNEILTIVNGYYFSLDKTNRDRIFADNFQRIVRHARNFNAVAGDAVNRNKSKIDSFLWNELLRIKGIDQLSEFQDNLPVDPKLLEKIFEKTRTFHHIFDVLSYGAPWENKIETFAKYKITDVPISGDKYYLDNMYYDAIKNLYLLYMREGFTQEVCNALFLQHFLFLREEGILSILGKSYFFPAIIHDSIKAGTSPREDYGYYYYERNNKGEKVYYRMKYYRVESPHSGNGEFIKYELNIDNLLKKSLRKAKKGSKEFVAISIYLDNLNKDNKFKGQ
jgi:hypothetical protein